MYRYNFAEILSCHITYKHKILIIFPIFGIDEMKKCMLRDFTLFCLLYYIKLICLISYNLLSDIFTRL